MKKIKPILLFPITLILIISGLILYKTTIEKPEILGCATISPVAICGNNDSPDAMEGKEIFNSNCAACHKLDSKSTGPALRAVDSLVFVKWMSNKNQKIDSIKIKDWGINYHRIAFKDIINEKALASLIKYCNYNQY
jgi:cytochrome c551/c552